MACGGGLSIRKRRNVPKFGCRLPGQPTKRAMPRSRLPNLPSIGCWIKSPGMSRRRTRARNCRVTRKHRVALGLIQLPQQLRASRAVNFAADVARHSLGLLASTRDTERRSCRTLCTPADAQGCGAGRAGVRFAQHCPFLTSANVRQAAQFIDKATCDCTHSRPIARALSKQPACVAVLRSIMSRSSYYSSDGVLRLHRRGHLPYR